MSRVENEYSNYCANDKCRKPISDMVFYCSRECRDNEAVSQEKSKVKSSYIYPQQWTFTLS